MAPLIGEAIRRIHRGESVGALFSSESSWSQEMLLWEDGSEGTIDTRGVDGEIDARRGMASATTATVQAATDEPQAP